ncbi:branched-chain amino acid transporter AzlC [Actibacterium pelagium]|uniref:Branched-chain amino acid transporter AzlC n=2 Tax=Actibacterium pelagium TaxID=2029103 RepID=A0A917EKK9_9RHOB|nr:branched-chain amino acid transporter AzlC [Actibacterium pelagium]
MIDGSPFLLVLVPFGMLFGVVGTEAGLNLAQVMGFTALVIAGAAQFATVQLLVDDAPTIIAILTGLAVNVRMAMYSASLAPYLGNAPLWKRALAGYLMVDQVFALTVPKYEAEPELTINQRYRYYFGTMVLVAPAWYAATLFGAVLGQTIPPEYALDFALPITFLALVAPALKTLAHVAAAVTSVIVALALASLPFNIGLLIAAFAAMIVGARVELALQGRAAS